MVPTRKLHDSKWCAPGSLAHLFQFHEDEVTTYARWWIKAAISSFVLRSWSMVRIGSQSAQKKLFFTLRKANQNLSILDQGDLSLDEAERLSDLYSIPAQKITQFNQRMPRRDYSLNQRVGDSDNMDEYLDLILAEDPDPEINFAEAVVREYNMGLIAEAITDLDERDREIITQRWMTEEPASLENWATVMVSVAKECGNWKSERPKKLKPVWLDRRPATKTQN